jgi:hypothetical protein
MGKEWELFRPDPAQANMGAPCCMNHAPDAEAKVAAWKEIERLARTIGPADDGLPMNWQWWLAALDPRAVDALLFHLGEIFNKHIGTADAP